RADEYSTVGAECVAFPSAIGLPGDARRTRQARHEEVQAGTTTSIGQLIHGITIFSPEDGAPFSQQPPSLREGRRRFLIILIGYAKDDKLTFDLALRRWRGRGVRRLGGLPDGTAVCRSLRGAEPSVLVW